MEEEKRDSLNQAKLEIDAKVQQALEESRRILGEAVQKAQQELAIEQEKLARQRQEAEAMMKRLAGARGESLSELEKVVNNLQDTITEVRQYEQRVERTEDSMKLSSSETKKYAEQWPAYEAVPRNTSHTVESEERSVKDSGQQIGLSVVRQEAQEKMKEEREDEYDSQSVLEGAQQKASQIVRELRDEVYGAKEK